MAAAKAHTSLAQLEASFPAAAPRDFAGALTKAAAERRFGLICEVKKASPSKGVIQPNFEPARHAAAYQSGGAACLSVLTDTPFFQGSDADFAAARAAAHIPMLRKDFMIDTYQVAEARAMGADCILLIIAALSPAQALELEAAATQYGLQVLAEVHAVDELEMAMTLKTPLVGVNNRNLKTLEVDTRTTAHVAKHIGPARHIVGESGLSSHADLAALEDIGITRFLIGESLMRAPDQSAAVAALLSGATPS